MCGFSFSLQNGTLGIVGEIIAFECKTGSADVLLSVLMKKNTRRLHIYRGSESFCFDKVVSRTFPIICQSFPSCPHLLSLMLCLCTLL